MMPPKCASANGGGQSEGETGALSSGFIPRERRGENFGVWGTREQVLKAAGAATLFEGLHDLLTTFRGLVRTGNEIRLTIFAELKFIRAFGSVNVAEDVLGLVIIGMRV